MSVDTSKIQPGDHVRVSYSDDDGVWYDVRGSHEVTIDHCGDLWAAGLRITGQDDVHVRKHTPAVDRTDT